MEPILPMGLSEGVYDPQLTHSSGYPPYNMWAMNGRGDNRGIPSDNRDLRMTVSSGSDGELTRSHPGNAEAGVVPVSSAYQGEVEDSKQDDWADDSVMDNDEKTSQEGSQKQSQVAATLKWLSENYERSEGVCLPRCVLYTHYLDFCKKTKFSPAGAATFGKVIRQKFTKLTTRRLGTRGQSKYHYYGIGIKESSIYYHSVYSGKGLTRFSGIKIKTEVCHLSTKHAGTIIIQVKMSNFMNRAGFELYSPAPNEASWSKKLFAYNHGSNRKYSLSSKTGTLLPEFPDVNNLVIPDGVEKDKMETFLLMYRTHSQRILDTIIGANFEEVQNFLLHFWQGMPEHLLSLLESSLVVDIVALCDSILYKVLVDVLIPTTIQDIPESLNTEVKQLVRRLPHWLDNALEDVPKPLRVKKLEVVKGFIQSMNRQISFVQLAQTCRGVLLNNDVVSQMLKDMASINFPDICSRAGFFTPENTNEYSPLIMEYFEEFQSHLRKQAPMEAYTEWLDNIIDKFVIQPDKNNSSKLKKRASRFVLYWAILCSLFMRELTLLSATSFATFHLLHMTFDEYVFLVVETQEEHARDEILQRIVQKNMKNAEEIKMTAKHRTPLSKGQHSPKSKKRKHIEESLDVEESNSTPTTDHQAANNSANDNSSTEPQGFTPVATAFARPLAVNGRDSLSYEDDSRHQGRNNSSFQLSPLKPYPSFNQNSFDRPTYLPQYMNTYNDFVGTGSGLSSSRLTSYGDSVTQAYPAVGFNSGFQNVGAYWSETRTHSSIPDPYGYQLNKFHPSAYDPYPNKTPLVRTGSYQDCIGRSKFDSSRSYYRPSHESIPGMGSHFGSYNNSALELANPCAQYGRQDVLYQDDFYSNALASNFPSIPKPYISTPFR